MKSFKEYLLETPNTQRRYCPKCQVNSMHDKDYDYGFDDPDYDENKPPKVFMKCRGCGHKTEVKVRGKRLKEEMSGQEIVARHMDRVHPDKRAAFRKHLERARKNGQPLAASIAAAKTGIGMKEESDWREERKKAAAKRAAELDADIKKNPVTPEESARAEKLLAGALKAGKFMKDKLGA